MDFVIPNDTDKWEEDIRRETVGDSAHQALFKLARELEAQDPVLYAKVIKRCRDGSYHDFATKLPAPKMQMHADLLEVNLVDIDRRMQDGEFDSD